MRHILVGVSRRDGHRHGDQHVVGVFDISVQGDQESAVEHRSVNTYVILLYLFPAHIGIGHHPRSQTRYLVTVKVVLHGLQHRGIGIVAYTGLVTGDTVSGPYFQVAQSKTLVEPLLLTHSPGQRNRGENAPTIGLAETRTAIGTHGGGKEITVVVGIVDTTHEREEGPVATVTRKRRFENTVGQLLCRLADKALYATAHEFVGIGLCRRTDHGCHRMLAIERLVEGKQVIPQPGETLVVLARSLRLGLLDGFPVILGCPALAVPEEGLNTESALEGEPLPRLYLGIDITEQVVTLGGRGILHHLADGVGYIAHIHGQSYGTGPRPVLVLDGLGGQSLHGVLYVILALRLDVVIERKVMPHLQPFVQFHIGVELKGKPLVVGRLDNTLLVIIGTRHVVMTLLGSTRIIGRVGLGRRILEEFAHPVGTLAQFGGIVEEGILGLSAGTHHLVMQRRELRGIEQGQGALQLIETVGHFHIQVVAFLRTFLGGNDNHTIGSARTVDSRGRCIFENIDTLHVVHVDHIQRHIGRYTVDNQKRVTVVDRTYTSDFHAHVTARGSGRNDLQTGCPTLQGGTETR